MDAMEIVEGMAAVPGRGAGTDAERRAAAWLASELDRGGTEAFVETFWCRPDWALAGALHAALAVAGSLISLLSPVAGIAILAVTLGSLLADSLAGVSLGRRLTRERASQNVIWAPPEGDSPVRLILTANYDAGRMGLVYRDWFRRPTRILRAFTPGWLGWMWIATAWLEAIAVIRLAGHITQTVRVAQLPPTVALLTGFALLIELALASWSPAAGDNASGVAVAVALARALETVPPQHLEVELVLTGAGDGDQAGPRRYLRSRPNRRAANTVVLGIAACAAGSPRWWFSDGPLIPFRFSRPLRELAAQIAVDEPQLEARAQRSRGTSPALPARLAGIPAITLGCLDPHSHQPGDTPDAVDPAAIDRALQFALLLVDAIDAVVGELQSRATATPA
jgi:hypothetical protein